MVMGMPVSGSQTFWWEMNKDTPKKVVKDMQIKYVSTSMAESDFAALFADKNNMPGQQGPKFNRLLAEGLAESGAQVHACTGRPVTSGNCRKRFLPAAKTEKTENLTYYYHSILNLPVVKTVWNMVASYFAVMRGAKKGHTAVVCDVLNAAIARGAVLAAKHRKLPCVGILTDMPDLMVTGTNAHHSKLVEKTLKDCTAYVLLTEAMNKKINPQGKPYVIIEGLCDRNMQHMEKEYIEKPDMRTCVYAGYLDTRYGVKDMVDGFLMADIADAQLHIYGNGPYEEELRQVSSRHPNVFFHGVLLNHEVVHAELEADLLVNPRPTHEEFTKFSFPSKNLEYMVSGTAVLTTKLPGMPEEYCDYVYLAQEESPEGFAKRFRELLSLPREELDHKGAQARKFVLEHKNNVVQAQKILDLLQK